MDFIRSIMFPALIAGALTGMFSSGVHLATTIPLIERAEVFEHVASEQGNHVESTASQQPHSHAVSSTTLDFQRGALTIVAMVLAYTGFALVLAAVGTIWGGLEGWRSGLFLGIAGFAAFALMPGLGLPAELPAMPAAELGARQIWWVATVICTLSGMGTAFYLRNTGGIAAAALLLLAPYLIGAPQPVDDFSPIPADLHWQFEKLTFLVNLASWVFMGAVLGWLTARMHRRNHRLVGRYV